MKVDELASLLDIIHKNDDDYGECKIKRERERERQNACVDMYK